MQSRVNNGHRKRQSAAEHAGAMISILSDGLYGRLRRCGGGTAGGEQWATCSQGSPSRWTALSPGPAMALAAGWGRRRAAALLDVRRALELRLARARGA